MQKITLKDGVNFPFANYNDGDIFISNDFSKLTCSHAPFKMAMTLIILCIDGNGSIILNDKMYNFTANDMIIITPNTVVNDGNSTENIKFRILAFDVNNLKNTIILNKDIWKNANFVKTNPVCKLSDYQCKVMNHYFELADLYVQNTQDIYQKEKMNNLIRCWIYDLLTMISENSDFKKVNKEIISSNEVILQRFVELLSSHEGKMRSVQKTAAQLCISPKYLSHVIKQSSGKTAQEIIHSFTIDAIKEQLKYSGKSIKEISNDMDFTEPSFFGKFFKQQTGITPLQYRKQVLKQQNGQKGERFSQEGKQDAEIQYSKDKKLNKEISSLFSVLNFMMLM